MSKEELDIVNNALTELKAIKKSSPSEALKKLDIIESELWDSDFHYQKYSKELDIIKQALIKAQEQDKVLEIIFKKEVSIFQLKCCKNVNEYNDLQFKKDKKLTQEEFELLKRYLDNEKDI